jgi:hypothetical protein
MSMARTTCPDCDAHGSNVVDLADLLFSAEADYFRCRACSCWWMVPKGADGPSKRNRTCDEGRAGKGI